MQLREACIEDALQRQCIYVDFHSLAQYCSVVHTKREERRCAGLPAEYEYRLRSRPWMSATSGSATNTATAGSFTISLPPAGTARTCTESAAYACRDTTVATVTLSTSMRHANHTSLVNAKTVVRSTPTHARTTCDGLSSDCDAPVSSSTLHISTCPFDRLTSVTPLAQQAKSSLAVAESAARRPTTVCPN